MFDVVSKRAEAAFVKQWGVGGRGVCGGGVDGLWPWQRAQHLQVGVVGSL